MIDPPDRLLERYVEGDVDTVPENGSGEWGERPAGVVDITGGGAPRVYRQFFRVIAANGKVQLYIDDIPQYWVVRVNNVASNGAFVYPYNDVAGEPIQVDANNKARLPGISQYLTIIANSTGATVSVMAVRGYPYADM